MILIVDDQANNIFSLKKLLEHNNFQVDTASSGEEALRKILKNIYALIILDVQMPDMDGFEVAEAISGYSKAKDIPIIFLSAVAKEKQFIEKGYASGGIDYITKPVDPDILILKAKTFYRLHEQTQQLIKAKDDLNAEIEIRKAAEKKKDEFISIASHELKTPLTSIKGYLQLSERALATKNSENAKKYIQRTQIQLEKLNNLVADLLDISKIESGKMKLNKKTFNFQKLLRNAVDIVRQTTNGHEIMVNAAADAEVYGDEVRIEQVIINYLTNAIKYSPHSQHIQVNAHVEHDRLKVSVKDAGIGIPAEKQKKIFQKFYRVEESSNRFQGLGIGLYICAEILKRHQGTYGVQSIPGEGSEFYFTLPVLNTSNKK